ncbi:MAG: ComF family protein [Lachnospiraceae bacterium]|nr:ComF family protein [Lachnospiraceae bacterium]
MGRTFDAVMHMLYPRRCPVCDDAVSPAGADVCRDCRGVFPALPEETCAKCGKPLSARQKDEGYCGDCLRIDHAFDRGFSLFSYRDVAPSVYRFKYKGRQEYASYYAGRFVKRNKRALGRLSLDALIPVPLAKKKLQKRGYNQAEVFARALSGHLRVPVMNDIITRVRDTKPQKELDYYGRRNNLKNAFIMKKNDVSLKSVALVDDIYTTGSTADEIASLLKQSGVRFVYVFTPAIGQLQS